MEICARSATRVYTWCIFFSKTWSFLVLIALSGPKDVDQCLFGDSLVTLSDTGRVLGEFCVTVEKASYHDEPCYLVHANSHGKIDNIPCGTSITGESSIAP